MTRKQFRHFLTIAERDGVTAALAREAGCDDGALEQFHRDAYGFDDDPVCAQDDEHDSRGARLRPRVNEAGEPWWM